MSRIRACACGLRSTAAWSVSGPTATSSAYRPWPRRNRWSSTRWTGWPISLVVIRPPARSRRCRPRGPRASSCARLGTAAGRGGRAAPVSKPRCELGGPLDRLDDVLVARAAAQVARDHVAGLLVRGAGVVLQPGVDGGQEARRAEAALEPVALGERLLHRAERAVGVGEPLDGGDLEALRGDREHQAGAHRPAVDQDRAGAADAVLAADVGAGEAEVVAQRVGQQPARGHAGRRGPCR